MTLWVLSREQGRQVEGEGSQRRNGRYEVESIGYKGAGEVGNPLERCLIAAGPLDISRGKGKTEWRNTECQENEPHRGPGLPSHREGHRKCLL